MYLHRRSKLIKLYLLIFCGLLVNQLTKKRLRLTAAFSFMLATRLPHTAHSHTRSHTISNYAPPTTGLSAKSAKKQSSQHHQTTKDFNAQRRIRTAVNTDRCIEEPQRIILTN
ncbi:hypothetical protein CTAM01_11331 [Colletotrichum tamarilloi]|uniref:Secreted protein n=1 Tax=Colletotrichum tamarilloi TaxID=1209934 RepID=A0ABQ9QY09_9PEZI|nr:uncharacterized protein CTAM01_11331 [Colletotrichum tamarilloi]KAK1489007.1 hypothetical protein CTAM01_11331 [Colletotrichum tamarilloi]